MKHNDSWNGRELARLAPPPAERDLPAGRQQILKEYLMSEFRRADKADQAPAQEPAGKRSRIQVAIAGAGVLAIAAAVALGVSAAHPTDKRTGNSAPTTAGQLLAMIAQKAGKRPSTPAPASGFEYIRSEVAYSVYTIANGHETSTMAKLHQRQIWLPVADICVTGLLIEDGSSTPISPFPVVNGKVDRSQPTGLEPKPNFTCPSEGHLGDATYRLMQSMPTDPGALLSYLKAGKKWTNDDPAQEIGDLIREAIVPPALNAALYRTAELLPGATLVPDAMNAVGRHGIAIAWDTGGYRSEWIFDKSTLQYIGERDYDLKTGVVNGESAIVQSAFVSKAGTLP
ncbi:MAG: CU044_5270 family protein [Actinobacteria bacterium]|nr:CU044_5270 family protein [Actinomycetota bacterium]MBO0834023.1 CU044_5270 family protein [Actinomycetota bacterium]